MAHDVKMMQRLIDAGADVNERDDAGNNVLMTSFLHCAAYTSYKRHSCHEACLAVTAILAAGVDHHAVNEVGQSAVPFLAHSLSIGRLNDFERRRRLLALTALLMSKGVPIEVDTVLPLTALSHLRGLFHLTDLLPVLLVAGARPLRSDFIDLPQLCVAHHRHICDVALRNIRLAAHFAPYLLENINDDLLRDQIASNIGAEADLSDVRREWHRALWQRCSERVTDIANIFIRFPALVIVEICLFDMVCLNGLRQPLLWNAVCAVKERRKET